MVDIAKLPRTELEDEEAKHPGLIGVLMSLPGPLIWSEAMDYARRSDMISSSERKGKFWILTPKGNRLLNEYMNPYRRPGNATRQLL